MRPSSGSLALLAVLALSVLSVLSNKGFAEEKISPPPAPASAPEDTPPQGQAPDPFAAPSSATSPEGIPGARLQEARQALQLRVEVWEAPALELARRQDGGQSPVEITRWREEWLTGKDSAQLVLSPTLGLDSATRATSSAVSEFIYPTEYEPPTFPGGLPTPAPDATKKNWWETLGEVATKTTPTAFETRNTGETVQAVAQPVAVAKNTWDVSIRLEDVALMGFSSTGHEDLHVEMPIFSSFETGGLIRLKEGEWRLLATTASPREAKGVRAKTRWVTLVRIDPVKAAP